jgi:hypothetical protein
VRSFERSASAVVLSLLAGCGVDSTTESDVVYVATGGGSAGSSGVSAAGAGAGGDGGRGDGGRSGAAMSTAGASTGGAAGGGHAGESATGAGHGGASAGQAGGVGVGGVAGGPAGAGGASGAQSGAGPCGATCSKIGAQVIDPDDAFSSYLALCPRIAKWIVAGGTPPWDQMSQYRAQCQGITVLRMYGPPGSYPHGQDLWDARYAALGGATDGQKASVDFLESDNECDAGHCFSDSSGQPSMSAAADYGAFLGEWVTIAAAQGFHPLVGNIAVGNPGGAVGGSCSDESVQVFGQLVPAIVSAGKAGGGWGYHGYSAMGTPTTSLGTESYYSLRYRYYEQCFASDLASVPLVLTETGLFAGDIGENLPGADAMYSWLHWLSHQLDQDAYVAGATLFTFASNGQWGAFALDGQLPQLESLLTMP